MRSVAVQIALSNTIDGAKAGLTAAQKKAFVTMWARAPSLGGQRWQPTT